jgi:hypothetical protein
MTGGQPRRAIIGPNLGILAALGCLLLGELAVQLFPPGTPALAGLALHLVAVAIFLAGRSGFVALPHTTPRPLFEGIAASSIVLLAAALYIVALTDYPYRIDGDAAAQANNALEFLGSSPPPLIGTGWYGRSNLYYFLDSLALRAFGPTLFGLRIFGALGGVLAVLFTFLFARSVIGVRGAIFAALAMAIMPYHVAFARTGLESEHTVWIAPLTFWLIWLGWKRRDLPLVAAGGGASGFALYFYQSALLLPLLVAGQLMLLAFFAHGTASPRDAFRRFAVTGAVAFGGFVIAYLPMIVFAFDRPDEYFGRARGQLIFGSEWLEGELRTRTLFDVLATGLIKAILPFHYQSRPVADIFSTPYLTISESAAFSLGLLLLWIGRIGPLWFRWFVAVHFAAGFIFLGALTLDSPIAARYVLLLPVLATVIGLAFGCILDALRAWLPARIAGLAMTAALAGYGAVGLNELIARERGAIELGQASPTDIIATGIGRALASSSERDYNIVFLNAPLLYFAAHPGLKFLTQRVGVDIGEDAGCPEIAGALLPGVNYIIAPDIRMVDLAPFREPTWQPRTLTVPGEFGKVVAALLRVVIPEGEGPGRVCSPAG